jgi:hypothetical protein
MGDFFPEDEILDQGRTAFATLERILVIENRNALVRGKRPIKLRDGLMNFTALGRPHRRRFG